MRWLFKPRWRYVRVGSYGTRRAASRSQSTTASARIHTRSDADGKLFRQSLRQPVTTLHQSGVYRPFDAKINPKKYETLEDMAQRPARLAHAKGELGLLQQILCLSPPEKLNEGLQDAVLICIDCEAYEFNQDKVTEIGVAVLDTKNIKSKPTSEFMSELKYTHYRIRDHSRLLNRRFVKGCEENFNFGETAWINLADAGTVLSRIFSDPTQLHQAADLEVVMEDAKRNIILVGHGLSSDKGYMDRLGFNPMTSINVIRSFDTQVVAGGTKKVQIALWRLLSYLDIQAVNLHNAGNDAAYALQALVVMALKDFEAPGSVFTELEQHSSRKQSKKELAGPSTYSQKTSIDRRKRQPSSGRVIKLSKAEQDNEAVQQSRGQKRAMESEPAA